MDRTELVKKSTSSEQMYNRVRYITGKHIPVEYRDPTIDQLMEFGALVRDAFKCTILIHKKDKTITLTHWIKNSVYSYYQMKLIMDWFDVKKAKHEFITKF